jgi:hypothetical protein
MAISNIHETLLMYTKQKSMISKKLGEVMMNMLSSTQQSADSQSKYNSKQQNYYFQYYMGGQPDQYELVMEELEMNHEFELAKLNAWEMQLELEKSNLETKMNEITTFEQSWTKLLGNNIKKEFSYGGGGGS